MEIKYDPQPFDDGLEPNFLIILPFFFEFYLEVLNLFYFFTST